MFVNTRSAFIFVFNLSVLFFHVKYHLGLVFRLLISLIILSVMLLSEILIFSSTYFLVSALIRGHSVF